jgi:hypothetical protein
VFGKLAVVSFGEVSKPFEELLVENSILIQSPRLVLQLLLELPQLRVCSPWLWLDMTLL